jgi:DNA-directed RNA polymerase specialized sigma24 family protein
MEPKYRDVLSFYLIYDMTFKEISDLMQIPLSTVHSRFNKGEKMIIEKFKEEGYDG